METPGKRSPLAANKPVGHTGPELDGAVVQPEPASEVRVQRRREGLPSATAEHLCPEPGSSGFSPFETRFCDKQLTSSSWPELPICECHGAELTPKKEQDERMGGLGALGKGPGRGETAEECETEGDHG